ncbi:hypothetical protein BO83DRAFT_398796 [Aspergillus eucalypticola CBS 122712]|uniref:Uncharacterized protein n=1 Tax=Aspergillus eucalypticola (strain CBS 122712 / IBT 29274) TaxID=1448314 RepID=A0A317VJL6_ASPEC|nr:uncharacterized protein BO83DRAFT_398796 [Aspergillus eucalypticola CBS 122712]PWY73367.1 hypothetical protein BO83DRAFT_398796 [Aspergillus eucalypticola CBS 122712]
MDLFNFRSSIPAKREVNSSNETADHRPVVHGRLHMPGGRSEQNRDLKWTRTRKSNRLARLKFAGREGLLTADVRENQLEQRMRDPQSNYRDGKSRRKQEPVRLNEERPRPAAATPPEFHLPAAHQSLLNVHRKSSPHIWPGWMNHHWKYPQQALNCRGGLFPMETLYYGNISPITIYLLYATLACASPPSPCWRCPA